MSSAISKALAFVRQGDGDLSQYRAAKRERAMKMAAGKPPVNLKAFRAALAASEASTPTPPTDHPLPAGEGRGEGKGTVQTPATPSAPKCFGCGATCSRHDFCHTCREHFCMHCDQLPAPPRNHSPQDHLKAP